MKQTDVKKDGGLHTAIRRLWSRIQKGIDRGFPDGGQWAEEHAIYVRQLNWKPVTVYVNHLLKRVENLYAQAKEWHGLDCARGRRLWRMQIQIRMTAITQNFKRMAHFLHRHSSMIGQSLAYSFFQRLKSDQITTFQVASGNPVANIPK
ncbi:hypothetical protein [Paludifilum halophilum]|nr:hypothetical protein [Paludifilum halophilum]